MSSKVCHSCGGEEVEEDPSRGEAVCTGCGAVLAENIIVAENNFQETGGGGHSLIGHVITSDGPQRGSMGIHGITGKESREVTLQNGRERIRQVASRLRISQNNVDTAFSFYKMAVSRGLTKGRKSNHVVAACLYMTCRMEGTHHLLLDFSDVLNVNLYELGRTFSFIALKLHMKFPNIDPCLYIPRFANGLHFGDKEQQVSNMACRLVQRMQRDWIGFGRRPTGICGAALILAARYHNFNRSLTDVVKIVNIGEPVLRKRLLEFAATPSSSLTLDEFQSVDLESEEDPPAFRLARQKVHKEKLKQQQQEQEKIADSLQEELIQTEKEVEKAINADTKTLKKKNPLHPTPSPSPLTVRSASVASNVVGTGEASLDPDLAEANQFVQQEILNTVVSATDIQLPPTSTYERYKEFRPTLESLGIRSNSPPTQPEYEIAPGSSREPVPSTSGQGNGDLELEGIDDSELDNYILSDAERIMKTKIWMEANGRYLIEAEEKRKLRLEQEEKERLDPTKKKQKRGKRKVMQGATASEAIEKVIKERKISNKINYEVLRSLTTPTPTPTPTANNVQDMQENNTQLELTADPNVKFTPINPPPHIGQQPPTTQQQPSTTPFASGRADVKKPTPVSTFSRSRKRIKPYISGGAGAPNLQRKL